MKKILKILIVAVFVLVGIGTVAYAQTDEPFAPANPFVNGRLLIGAGTNPNVQAGIAINNNAPAGVAALRVRVRSSGTGVGFTDWENATARGSQFGSVNLAANDLLWTPLRGANRDSLVTGQFRFVSTTSALRPWQQTADVTFQLRR